MSNETARLNVKLDKELEARLDACVPRGMKSILIRILLEALVEHIEKNGKGILGEILSKRVDTRNFVQILNISDRR